MLQKLTPSQTKRMQKVRDEWLNRLFDCTLRTNRVKATQAITWLYELCGYKKPTIVFLSSPLACQLGPNLIQQVQPSMMEGQVSGQVRDQVRGQVRGQVWGQVRDQVRDQVWGQVKASKLNWFGFCSYGSVIDYEWVSFYEYFKGIKSITFKPDTLEKLNNFIYLLKSGIYDMVQFEKIVFVSDMPTKITRDEQNRLHNESGHAIEWADGYGQYWYHGVCVTENIILHPEKLTKKDWQDEQNLERRRIIQEVLGERFPKLLKAKTIKRSKRGVLVEVELPGDPDRVARYVHVKDSSTDRKYYLRVPPTTQTPDEGVAWTFNMSESDYNPIKET